MKDYEMTCVNCFYSDDSYEKEIIEGRDENGVEVEAEGVYNSFVVCKVEPVHRVVSKIDGDISQEPEYHKCGHGKWWDGAEYIGWINREEE